MKHPSIFSFCNQKGGVGKTTTVINLAAYLSQKGRRVLVIDIDPQANTTSGLGESKKSDKRTIHDILLGEASVKDAIRLTKIKNIHLISSNSQLSGAEIELINENRREFKLKEALLTDSIEYDHVFIDCPPSLGLLTVNSLAASDYIFIPLQCEYYAMEGLGDLLETYSLIKRNLNRSLEVGGVLLTMADFRTKLTEQVVDEVRKYFNEKVFNTIIPRSVKLSEAPSFGIPGILYDKSARGAKAYVEAGREFAARFSALPKMAEDKPEETGVEKLEERKKEEVI